MSRVLSAVLLVVAACSSSDGESQNRASGTAPPTTESTLELSSPGEAGSPLECELEGFPCSLAEVPVEVLQRSDSLSSEVLSMFEAGSVTTDAVEWLEEQSDVVDVRSTEQAIRFRVEGGRGTWVVRASALATTRGGIEAPVSDPSVIPHPWAQLFDVVGRGQQEEMGALVLSPMFHQFAPLDEGEEVAKILSQTRGYEGRVVYAGNTTPFSDEVNVESFKGWNQYQVIHLITHGWTICDPSTDDPCTAAIASHLIDGELTGDGPEIDHREFAETIKQIREKGAELGRFEDPQGRGLDLYRGPTMVLLTGDFFRAAYPQGLDNTIVFFNGCNMIGDRPTTDIVEALRGETSVFVGWDNVIWSHIAYEAAVQFYSDLSDGGYTVGRGLDMLGTKRTDPFGTQLLSSGRRSGGDLRIREVVTSLDPGSSCPLADGDSQVSIEGTTNDDQNDSVPFKVRVDGIPVEHAEEAIFKVHVEPGYVLQAHIEEGVEDRVLESVIEPIPVSSGRPIGDGSWLIEGVAPAGNDVITNVAMTAWVDLPEGGQSSDFVVFGAGNSNDSDLPEDSLVDSDQCREAAIDFRYLEQRHNVWVRAWERVGGNTIEDEYELNLVSIDSDPTMQSTVTIDREPMPISPLGFEGYTHPVVTVAAGSTTASAGLDFDTEVSGSRVRISGLYERSLKGAGGAENASSAVGVASSGVLFAFEGGPMHVVLAWSCTLEVGLMSIEDRERKEVLVDNNADDCTGRYEGTLEAGVTYQLLASVGIFDERQANDGRVYRADGSVLCECPSYDVVEAGDFRLDLTPVG